MPLHLDGSAAERDGFALVYRFDHSRNELNAFFQYNAESPIASSYNSTVRSGI